MNIEPVIAQLAGVTGRPVGTAAALALLREGPQFFPGVFVVPDRETAAAPRAITGIHDQVLTCEFVVVVMVRAEAAAAGRMQEELDGLIAGVEDRLVGWVHPDADGQATAHAGSALLTMRDGRIDWALRFRTQRRIRRQVTKT